MELIKKLIVLLPTSAILALVMMAKCEGPRPTTIIEEVIDTVIVSKVDTVYFPDTVYNIVPEYIVRRDTVYLEDSLQAFDYDVKVEDSLISGSMLSTIQTDGTLVYQELKYTPKFPQYINKTDSIFITKTITQNRQTIDLYGGVMIAPYKEIAVIPTLGVATGRGTYYGIGIDPFNNNYYLDFKIKLTNYK